jgi:hypothetical protein
MTAMTISSVRLALVLLLFVICLFLLKVSKSILVLKKNEGLKSYT